MCLWILQTIKLECSMLDRFAPFKYKTLNSYFILWGSIFFPKQMRNVSFQMLIIPWFVRVWADENILITTSSNWTLNAFQTKHWMNEFVCNNGYTLQMLNTKCQLINAIILWIQLNKNKTKSTQSKCTISCEWKELLFLYW